MNCDKCKKLIKDCKCPDIDEKLDSLRNNPHYIYKMCDICKRHHDRCKCKDPIWVTSHDDILIEDLLNNDGSEELSIAQKEIKEAINTLRSHGIDIIVYKGNQDNLKIGASERDCTHYNKYIELGGKLN